MSVNAGARLRVAVAAALVVAVVIALVVRGTHHRRTSAAPPPAAPAGQATTTDAPPSGAPSAATTTAPMASTLTTRAVGGGNGATGARPGSQFANGAPAPLPVPAGTPLDPLPPPDAGWRPISVAQGTGNGANGMFTITSATTQVRFRASSGQFHLFVVDQTLGRDATAGYADVDCSGPCADLQTLSVPKGTYHVEVDADGPWEFSLEQFG